MATPNRALVEILRETADRIETGADYQWSHFGKCNCGHLAQTATRFSASQIHRGAFGRLAEWSEIPEDFCPQTGILIDRVVDALFELGLNAMDLGHLEDLTDREILHNLPGGFRYLERNQRQDAIAYMRSWADLIEAQLAVPNEVELSGDRSPRKGDPASGSDSPLSTNNLNRFGARSH